MLNITRRFHYKEAQLKPHFSADLQFSVRCLNDVPFAVSPVKTLTGVTVCSRGLSPRRSRDDTPGCRPRMTPTPEGSQHAR